MGIIPIGAPFSIPGMLDFADSPGVEILIDHDRKERLIRLDGRGFEAIENHLPSSLELLVDFLSQHGIDDLE